jgi:hypothetical protein
VIQHTVRDYFGTLRRCYESGLGRDSHLMGDIILSFVIGPDGSVTQVENDGGNMPDEYVVTCVLRRLEKLRFPKPEGGVVKVVYPIAFTSEP